MNETLDTKSSIIDSLYPNFVDYQDNGKFFYWMDYATELDELTYFYNDDLVAELNRKMLKLRSSSPAHDACVDVASTLEETIPNQFKGVFKYE